MIPTSKPAIRMEGAKLSGVGCLWFLFVCVLQTIGVIDWLQRVMYEVPIPLGLVISLLGLAIILAGPWLVLAGFFQAVTGWRTKSAKEMFGDKQNHKDAVKDR